MCSSHKMALKLRSKLPEFSKSGGKKLFLILYSKYFSITFLQFYLFFFLILISLQSYTFYTFCYFLESSNVWKKPNYDSLKNKCLVFGVYIYIYILVYIYYIYTNQVWVKRRDMYATQSFMLLYSSAIIHIHIFWILSKNKQKENIKYKHKIQLQTSIHTIISFHIAQ